MHIIKVIKYEPVQVCCSKMKETIDDGRVCIQASESAYHRPCFVGSLTGRGTYLIFKFCPFCGEKINTSAA